MKKSYRWIGGGKAGFFISTFPTSILSISRDELKLKLLFCCNYTFKPNQLYFIEKTANGIRIFHNIKDYPQKINFWSISDPELIIKEINKISFIPQLNKSEYVIKPSPIKSKSLILMAILWLSSILLDISLNKLLIENLLLYKQIGGFTVIIIFIFSLFSIFVNKIDKLKNILIKPGRSINEIKPTLILFKQILFIFSIYIILGYIY